MTLTPSRVLIAVHGFEPASWAADAARTISMWRSPELRLLIVPCVPSPPFTSLTPIARRAYADARAVWIQEEERRLTRIVDEWKSKCVAVERACGVHVLGGDECNNLLLAERE